ncbi:MAG: hypothetical protein HOL85_22420 [Rhodospirillaceae bacterium]|nr:hypothetical protein [Rhodospirillaceae bacterium]
MHDIPRTDEDLAKAVMCEEPEELYLQDARRLIGRVGGQYLQSVVLTPLEILHSSDQQIQLSNAGMSLTQMVQKAAIPQVKGTGIPVSERVRRLFELTDTVLKDTRAYFEEHQPEAVEPDGVAGLLEPVDGESDKERSFRIHTVLATTLVSIKSWPEKFDAVIALADKVQDEADFGPFDGLIAEITRDPKARKEIIGEIGPQGDEVKRLLALYDDEAGENDAPTDPPRAKVFNRFVSRAAAPETRETILSHLLAIVRSTDRFTKEQPAGELAVILKIAGKLKRGGTYLGEGPTAEALERRISRLISDDTIDILLSGAKSHAEKVLRVIELHGEVIGEVAQKYLEDYVAALLDEPKMDAKFAEIPGGPIQQLRMFGRLHKASIACNMAGRRKERFAQEFERMQGELIEAMDFYGKLDKQKTSTSDKALIIVDMIKEGAFAEGPIIAAARKQAYAFMKREDFLTSFLEGCEDGYERTARLKDLETRLVQSGLG